MRFVDIINKLFDAEDATAEAKINVLTILIQNDTFDQFSLDTFRWLDQVINRTYCCVQFELSSPGRRLPLHLNPNIQNMTLFSIQININCHSTGLQHYNYKRQGNHEPLAEQLTCKLPDGTTSIVISEKRTTAVSIPTLRSTKKPPERLALIVGLVGGASVLPCLLFACCMYILCKRNHQQHEAEKSQVESVWSDETASVASAYSYS